MTVNVSAGVNTPLDFGGPLSLDDLRQRMREIRMGTDELLYVLTDEKPGAVLRIEPAP